MKRRALAIVLCLVMVFSMVPAQVFAGEGPETITVNDLDVNREDFPNDEEENPETDIPPDEEENLQEADEYEDVFDLEYGEDYLPVGGGLGPALYPYGNMFIPFLSPGYVEFFVRQDNGNPVEGALITVGTETALTNPSGIAEIYVGTGAHAYTVTKAGSNAVHGTAMVPFGGSASRFVAMNPGDAVSTVNFSYNFEAHPFNQVFHTVNAWVDAWRPVSQIPGARAAQFGLIPMRRMLL